MRFLRNTRKTECGARLFLIRLAVRAAPFAVLKEHAQNGVRRDFVPDPLGGARRTLCAFEEHAQNGVRRDLFLIRLAVRAAPFALLPNIRAPDSPAQLQSA